MTKHKDIQDPKNFSEAHYKYFEIKLFSPDTKKEELEDICMTLGHLPTKQAQDLLEKFKRSERAHEVEWLECAIDEGKYLYLSPTNEQEERDYLALKVVSLKDDEIVNLMIKCDEHSFKIRTMNIELQASKELKKDDGKIQDIDSRITALEELIQTEEAELQKIENEIDIQEKIRAYIKTSIVTERYKDIDPIYMRSIHFDGEE